jgi:hypothetical protein
MKLYIYHGFDDETVPDDVTHVIVDESVTTIKKEVFLMCSQLVSVIMGDNVKRIEMYAFEGCTALRFVRLSRTLECIGMGAFSFCHSLEAVFLPSTVNKIEERAFYDCRSLRLLILPHDIGLSKVGDDIIYATGRILQIAATAGVEYEWNDPRDRSDESDRRVNEWLFHHMDEWPFHKLCYDSYVTNKQISDYLNENGNDAALAIDPHNGMTPLHMLSMNPHAPADTILTLLKANINAASVRDQEGETPLYYALHCNPRAFVRMYSFLREHTIEIEIQSWRVNPRELLYLYDDTDDTDGDDDTDDDVNAPGDTPLHVLARNPFVPANVIAALLELNMGDAFCPDNEGMSPLDCARESNVEGLISMIAVLCNHRNSISS